MAAALEGEHMSQNQRMTQHRNKERMKSTVLINILPVTRFQI